MSNTHPSMDIYEQIKQCWLAGIDYQETAYRLKVGKPVVWAEFVKLRRKDKAQQSSRTAS